MTEPRVAPLASSEIDAAQASWLAPFTDASGRYPNIFGILTRHMPLLEAWTPLGLYMMRDSRVPPPLREILILRTAHNAGSDYERHQHRRIALRIGLAETILDAIEHDTPTGDEDHDLMVACADDLARDARLRDATWTAMIERFGLETTLDAIFTVGTYTALAMALNSCDVQIERPNGAIKG